MSRHRPCCTGSNAFEPEPIPLLDAISLHSWAKWRAYRRLPWKLAFDVTVAVLAVVVTVLAVSQTGLYANSCSDAFDNLFGMGPQGETRIYDKDLLSTTVGNIVTRYFTLQNVTLSRLWHDRRNGTILPPVLTLEAFPGGLGMWDAVSRRYALPASLETVTTQYELTQTDPLGPLRNLSLIQNLASARIAFDLVSLNIGVYGAVPYHWRVTAMFDFVTGGGVAIFRTVAEKSLVQTSATNVNAGRMVAPLFLLAAAVFSIFLSVRALYRGWQNLRLVKRKVGEVPPSAALIAAAARDGNVAVLSAARDKGLPVSMQLEFFELWNLWSLFGATLLMTAAILEVGRPLFVNFPHFDVTFGLLLGMGTFVACANLLRHFSLSRRMSVLVNTLRLSFIRVLAFVLSCLPLFAGFVFLSVSLFSQHTERFATVDLATVSLFALMTGDDVHASFDEMTASYPYLWISRIFLYLYILLSICLLLNVFIFLTEDAFHEAKTVDRRGGAGPDGDEPTFTLPALIGELEKLEGATLYEVGPINAQRGRKQRRLSASDEDGEATPLIRGEDPTHLGAQEEQADMEVVFAEIKRRMQSALEQELELVRRELLMRRRPA